MNRLSLVLFLIICITTSCKKDTQVVDKNNGNEGTLNSGMIVLGHYANMNTMTYDTSISGGYHSPLMFNLDLDSDGGFDIQLISEIWGSPGVGMHPRSSIACINSNTYLLGYLKDDSIFYRQNITVGSGPNNVVEIYKNNIFTCFRNSFEDSVCGVSKNSFKVLPKNKSEVLSSNDFYKNDTITLIDDWYSYPSNATGQNSDTLVFARATYYNDCNQFPLADVKYIGFVIKKEGKEKLGWIKLCIFEKYKILLMESAIQK